MEKQRSKRFVMIGGFLGAGKTTSVLKFARWLHNSRGLRVGIVMNDQSNSLVDTALAEHESFSVAEIGGGCFCCKSDSLVEVMSSFTPELQPDVLIGEPVGSCTDLVSTVLAPLKAVYRTDYTLAPFSVVVDPFRAERICNGKFGGGFSEDVNYIYLKQLEEAEIILVNKADIFAQNRLEALCAKLSERFPRTQIMVVSARAGTNLRPWWNKLMNEEHSVAAFMPVDYDKYAAGEAKMAWLNAKYEVEKVSTATYEPRPTDPTHLPDVLQLLAGSILELLKPMDVQIGHLKMALLTNGDGGSEIAVIQYVGTDAEPTFTRTLDRDTLIGQLIINLRAEATPEFLNEVVSRSIEQLPPTFVANKMEYDSFSPSRPVPTHRLLQPMI